MSWWRSILNQEDYDNSNIIRLMLKMVELEKRIERKRYELKNAKKMGNDSKEIGRTLVALHMELSELMDKIKGLNLVDAEKIERLVRAA